MSSIFKALSSPFRIDSRGTNENAYSSYGQDEKLEFYILFSLNGFLGREKSGAHRAIISFCRPSTCLVKFTDQRDTKRLGAISIDIDSLAAISILSRYYKASSPAQKTGKMIGFAARTSEFVISFATNVTLTSNVAWVWAPNLEQRNLLIQEIDCMYTSHSGKPAVIEQIKIKDIVQRHKYITDLNSHHNKVIDKNQSISCKICNQMVLIDKLKEHKCVATEFVRCSLCNSKIPIDYVDIHCGECVDVKTLVVMIEIQEKLEELQQEQSVQENDDCIDQVCSILGDDDGHVSHRSPNNKKDVLV